MNADAAVGALLVDCVRQAPHIADRSRVDSLLARIPVGSLTPRAVHHGVAATVHLALDGVPLPDQKDKEALHNEFLRSTLTREQALSDLRAVDDALTGHAIPWLVVKGPAVAESLYPVPPMRSYGDLDLLVPPAALRQAVKLLESAGFALLDKNWSSLAAVVPGELHLQGPTGIVVDLHWHLLNTRALRREFHVDLGALFDQKVHVETSDGFRFPTTGPAHTCIHLALHGALSGGTRLVWLDDLRRSSGSLDGNWDATMEIAGRWRVDLVVATMLLRVHRTLGSRLTARQLADLGKGGAFQRAAALIDRASPPERDRGDGTAARMLARSLRHGTASTSIEFVQRFGRMARGRVGRGTTPARIRRDADDPSSVLYPSGGLAERDAFFAAVEGQGR